MTAKQNGKIPYSYFDAYGDFDEGVAASCTRSCGSAYLADDIPWTVGYSGGKDFDGNPAIGLVCIAKHWNETGA